MKSSGEQTSQLIENDGKFAIAAGKQADAAEKQAVAMGEYAKMTRDSLIGSQRAWVGPRNVRTDNAPALHQSLDAVVEYQNTGRDPATETVRQGAKAEWHTRALPFYSDGVRVSGFSIQLLTHAIGNP
jgi:hypothetical protein